jgi:hypothetical protein
MAIPETRTGGGADRLLALSGVAAVALILIAFVGLSGDTPTTGDSATVINAFYDEHSARSFIASFVLAAAAPFLVMFAIGLALALRQSGDRRTPWDLMLPAGGAVAASGFIVTALIHFALADAADQNGTAGASLQALNALDAASWVAFNAGLGVLMLAAAGALLSRKAYPAAGWIALLAGVALFIPFADFVALIVTGLWLIAMSIVLYRRGAAPARVAVV